MACGLYINSAVTGQLKIMKMSPLIQHLLSYSKNWSLRDDVEALLKLGTEPGKSWPDGFTYEEFHARWECLRYKLLCMQG